MKMSVRRVAHLTSASPKKLENHVAAIAVHYVHYGFCRVHQMSLCVKPNDLKTLRDRRGSVRSKRASMSTCFSTHGGMARVTVHSNFPPAITLAGLYGFDCPFTPERNAALFAHIGMVFLLTLTCYGSDLPGDGRGSFDHARQGNPHALMPGPRFESYSRWRMRQPPFLLSDERSRTLVQDAVVEVCKFRSWFLYALQVRANHIHGVVETESSAARVLNDWKSYATWALRAGGVVRADRIVWTHGGSAQRVPSREALGSAVRYVLEGQREAMEAYSRVNIDARPYGQNCMG